MKKIILYLIFSIQQLVNYAQPIDPSVDINFDVVSNGDFLSVVDGATTAKIGGVPNLDCGVKGNAFKMDGITNFLIYFGTINNFFSTADFSLSFYIKPKSNSFGTKDIFSKREACDFSKNGLSIRYNANAKQFLVDMYDPTRKVNLIVPIDPNTCWQHVVLVRSGNKALFYLNGTLKASQFTSTRVALSNNAFSQVSNSPCVGKSESRFAGLIDEFKFFKRALREDEVRDLYYAPETIQNRDTVIFKGTSFQVHIPLVCDSAQFTWTPNISISNNKISNPILNPNVTTTYKVTILSQNCQSSDTIQVTVVDPNDLLCDEIYMPNAFTPNEDYINDNYGIANPYAVQKLISFEIFDKWGGLVFQSTDPFQQWDGKMNDKPLNPGVFQYKISYECEGKERSKIGTFSLIR